MIRAPEVEPDWRGPSEVPACMAQLYLAQPVAQAPAPGSGCRWPATTVEEHKLVVDAADVRIVIGEASGPADTLEGREPGCVVAVPQLGASPDG